MNNEISTKQCPSRPCLAQVGTSGIDVTISPMGDCCTNLIQEVDPISLYMKKITAAILKGRVNCGSSDIGVEGLIVVATANDGSHYVGITDENGDYSICVPSSTSNTSYSIEAYCCSSCAGTVCEDGPCECGCKGSTSPSIL